MDARAATAMRVLLQDTQVHRKRGTPERIKPLAVREEVARRGAENPRPVAKQFAERQRVRQQKLQRRRRRQSPQSEG